MDIKIEVFVWGEEYSYGITSTKLDVPSSLIADIEFSPIIRKLIAEAAEKAENDRIAKLEKERDGQS